MPKTNTELKNFSERIAAKAARVYASRERLLPCDRLERIGEVVCSVCKDEFSNLDEDVKKPVCKDLMEKYRKKLFVYS